MKTTNKSIMILALVAGFLTLGATQAQADPPVIGDDQMQALTTTIGGAQVLQTTRTVMHWFGSTLDPNDGITYGYNIVGADPNNCSGSGCDVIVTVDIIPLNVIVEGESFNGSDAANATLASPLFALNDYGSTPFATALGAFPNFPAFIRGPGGVLSQNDAGNQLQLEDATMRAQFNKTGSSSYHLRLNPVVHAAVSIVIPGGKGTVLQSGRGVHFGDVDYHWWANEIQNLNGTLYVDPTHLPLYVTKDVGLFFGQNPLNCCAVGFHGASSNINGNGNQPLQTFGWASYASPGWYARPNGGTVWALQDIYFLSHEISEWSDDPFLTNTVEPWVIPTFPLAGCNNLLETGDPAVNIGFAIGTNVYLQGPNPNGTQSADGYYHPTDEASFPWFMRLVPNNISEPTQSPSTNVGRYSLMGDLNPFPGFHQPATGCN
jgi:hypothetical protein